MRRRIIRLSAALVCLTALPVLTTITPSASPVAAAAAGAPSSFTALSSPVRLADTRESGAVGEGVTISVAVTGTAGLPASGSVSAAVLNVTVVGPAGSGFWTVFPHGTPRPEASNINVDPAASFAGATLALPNLVTVPVGPDGIVDIFAQRGGHVLVDMLGYYSPTDAATSGRFIPLAAPSRMLDTRTTTTPFTAGQTQTFTAPGAAGSAAVALNVTAIGAAAGFWQVFPAGTTPPTSSNLNSAAAGHISANQVIVPVDAAGQFSVFSQTGGDLVIDIVGTFTGDTAPSSTVGLFVPLSTPTRFLDTRIAALNPLVPTSRLLPGWNLEVAVATNPAIGRTDVAAVALNITATDTFAAGYISVTPAGSNNPAVKARATSNLNVTRSGQTIANHAIVPISSRGFDVFSQNPTQVIADVSGYYLGAAAPSPFGTPQNVDPTPAFCMTFASEAILQAGQGAKNGNIAIAQQRLLDLGFWLQGADGSYGLSTQQAVMAYQKYNGLTSSGKIDAATAAKLSYPNCRPVAGTNSGTLMEVDKGKQLGIFINDGKLLWILNVSSGGNYFYEDEINGVTYKDTAYTDVGNFKVYRVSDEVRYEGSLGTMYRPRFVVRGIAVHGAPNVPNYPASHGCIRVSNPAMDMIWGANLLPMGGRVWIHE
ncbi:MAG: L,D-transpeptidase family protein [Ilumatobacteraceae bacterium]